jgi:hypothetical protein
MAKKDPWFKWVINRWFVGTRKMSFAAKGLYADLITLWRDGQVVPNDLHVIADMTGATDYRSVRKPLEELFRRDKVRVDADGKLFNPSVEDDIDEREEQRARKKSGGGGEGGSGPGNNQGNLPFRPRVVGGSVDDRVGERGNDGDARPKIAISPPSDCDQIANCSRSRRRKPLILHETHATSEKGELRNQRVVAVALLVAARARGDPTALRA